MTNIDHPSMERYYDFDFRNLPIGVYMVHIDGNFIVCNRTLREMLGLPLDGLIDANIKDFYANIDDRNNLIKKTEEADKQGKHIEKELVHFRRNGEDLYLEDFCKPMIDPYSGDTMGFVGCFVDVTEEVATREHRRELQKRVEELTYDIGRILHTNNTTLLMVDQTLTSIILALEPNPFSGMSVPQKEELEKGLASNANLLSTAVERFITVADEERRNKALHPNRWQFLKKCLVSLKNYKVDIPEIELQPTALYNTARDISQVCQEIKTGFLPKESIRELHRSAWHLLRVTILYDALKTRNAVLQMELALQSLREFITSDVRETSKRTKESVKYLVEQAISRLTGYAQSSQVDIRAQDLLDAKVNVSEREIVRSLVNLLHNAIKYSWRRDRTKPSWVEIRTFVKDSDVHIEFENWGVPISREEIEKGLVFQLGYRGEWSKDRGRLGTGIGLTDSLRVATLHGGNLFIESRPAHFDNENAPDYYTQPFITKATIVLPLTE